MKLCCCFLRGRYSVKKDDSLRGQKYLPNLATLEELGTFIGCEVRTESYIFMSRTFFVQLAFL